MVNMALKLPNIQGFLIPVTTAGGHNALLPSIKLFIHPGTRIVSGCWKTWLLDPDTEAHTQHIKQYCGSEM